jgi:hypothetical protein
MASFCALSLWDFNGLLAILETDETDFSMSLMIKIFDRLSTWMLDFSAGYWLTAHPEVQPRCWSNRELSKYAPLFSGDVVNVSAGMDEDKEGSKYIDYFTRARSYSITNYQPFHSQDPLGKEWVLDLSKPNTAPEHAYDVVFTHTVLEHIFELNVALDNICKMSRDIVITVVPFFQSMHILPGVFEDYWRVTPVALERLFTVRGFDTIYCDWNHEHSLSYVYIMHIASKKPDLYKGLFPEYHLPETSDDAPGSLMNCLLADTDLNKKRRFRFYGKWIGQRIVKFKG